MIKNKKEIIDNFKLHDKDSGSIEVQIAILTHRINDLNGEHFKGNPKDFSSKRGLIKLVGRRRRFLHYLKSSNESKYHEIITKLGIRG